MRILPSWEPEISMEKIITVYFEVHSLKHSYLPVQIRPSALGIPRAFDWSFAPYSGEFDP